MYLEISNPTTYSAGLYIRLSKEDDNEGQSQSVANQLSLLNDFVQQRGLVVYDTYIDDGWSGTSFERPGFQRLLADIEAGQVNMVITKDLSRLGRDYILTGHYMERYFPEKQVRYISLLDGIDTGVENAANEITPFRAILNDMYAKDISKKISSVKHDQQRKGLFVGGKPLYGYKMSPTEKNHIVIDEAVAPIVRRIFKLALTGMSCRQIAMQLNKEEIPTPARYANLPLQHNSPYSGRWSSERISDMLQNETYIGNMVQGRSRKVSYKSKKCVRQPKSEWIIVPETHEAIVDKAVFDKVQLLLAQRKNTRSRSYDFLLKGLIFCQECGYPLAVINRKTARGEDCLYFICRTYQRFTHSGVCTSHCVKEERVTAAVLERMTAVCAPYLQTASLLPQAQKALACYAQHSQPQQELSLLQAQLQRLRTAMDKIYWDYLSGVLEEQDFNRIYARAKAERSAVEQRVAACQACLCAAEQQDPAQELTNGFLATLSSNKELLCSLVERVELTADKQILIHFRFVQPEERP